MAVKIRFARAGRKKAPQYRLVACDSRMKRDGRFIEKIGNYNPINKEFIFDGELVQKWIDNGAQLSDTVARLLKKNNFALQSK